MQFSTTTTNGNQIKIWDLTGPYVISFCCHPTAKAILHKHVMFCFLFCIIFCSFVFSFPFLFLVFWGHYPMSWCFDLDRLQALQNKAVKLIFNTGKRDIPAPLLNTLHWLPIRERIKYKLCMYIYKCLNGTALQYLADFITYKPKGTRFTCSSIDTTLLTSQYARTSIGNKSFCISGP